MQRSSFVRPAVLLVLPLLIVAASPGAQAQAQGSRTAPTQQAPAAAPSADELNRLRSAVAADLDNVELRRSFAEALLAAGKPYPAIDQLEEALRRAPDDALTHQLLGACYRRLGKEDEAAASFRRALELDPSLLPAHAGLAAVLTGKGDLDGAIAQLGAILEADPDRFPILLARADLQVRAGRPESAVPDLARAVELSPQSVPARLAYQNLLVRLGRYGEARAVLEEGLTKAPDDPTLAEVLAKLLAYCPDSTVCDPERAISLADGAYRAASTPDHAATLALALAAAGRFDEAVALQSQLVDAAQTTGAPEAVVNELKRSLASYQRKERPALPPESR